MKKEHSSMKYFSDYFDKIKYNDDFGYDDIWNQEINKWLESLYELDINFYKKGKTRINKAKQRDEFLGEAKAIYYYHKFLAVTNIILEPGGKSNTKLDFYFIDKNDKRWQVEVKTPSWRGEVYKNTSLTDAQKIKRVQKPQYIEGDGGSFSHRDAIKDSIKNALPKFDKNQNNLLIITPNMFVELHESPKEFLDGILKEELKKQDVNKLISGIAILETILYSEKKEVEYKYQYFNSKTETCLCQNSGGQIGMIPEDWEVKTVSQLGKIVTGKTPKTVDKENFGKEYFFITPRDMKNQKHIFETERYLSEKGKNSIKNCLIPEKSVCVSCIGSDMGKVVMTTGQSITNQQINSIIPNISPEFVYYSILNISSQIKNMGKQSTALPILNKSQFSKMEVAIPFKKEEIEKITKILSDLDDKIELNRQMSKILESIAQAIFKRWFIDFEFPNEEGKPYKSSGGKMVNSELGETPEGWKVGCLGDLVKISIGGEWGNDGEVNGTVQAISLRGTDLESLKSSGFSANAPVRWIKKDKLKKRIINDCDILIGGSGLGPIGKTIYCSDHLSDLYGFSVTYSNFCKRLTAKTPAFCQWPLENRPVMASSKPATRIKK